MKRSNIRHSNSREAPNFKLQNMQVRFIGFWCLIFLWMLELGIWNFQIIPFSDLP
jgi:hypothetical protein